MGHRAWEYKFHQIAFSGDRSKTIMGELELLGLEGWEAWHLEELRMKADGDRLIAWHIYLKRPYFHD